MKKYIGFLFLLAGLLTFQSCLYDEPVENGEYGFTPESMETKKIIEFKGMYKNLGATNIRLSTISLLKDQPTKKVTLGKVHLAVASKAAAEDVKVDVKLSHDHIDGAKFPIDAITLDPVIIKAGESDAEIKATLKTDYVTVDGSAVKLALGTADPDYTISGNFGQMIVTIKERSKYEGTYRYEMLDQNCWGFDLKSGVNNGAEDYYMSTISPTRVICEPIYGYWNDQLILEFDPQTDEIIGCEWLDWDIWSVVKSETSYDPATKTYILSISPNGGKRHVVLKLTRLD